MFDKVPIGRIEGPGRRAYLAVAGGLSAPQVLGSRATFALGRFGGHATVTLTTGDVLHLAHAPAGDPAPPEPAPLTHDWQVGVLCGPHGAPDFFMDSDIAIFFGALRGALQLGPDRRAAGRACAAMARPDGGEAGLHPANLHDNACAVGAIDFTGDMPVILRPDGPSRGGFVCPAIIAREDLWKTGQFRPGDPAAGPAVPRAGAAVLHEDGSGPVRTVCRRQGDDNLLVEDGDMQLDIELRLRAHLLQQAIREAGLPVIDLTPGIRSLQVHHDGARLPRRTLIKALRQIEAQLLAAESVRVSSRIVHLPPSWNDPQAEPAMRKYQDLVRPDAPWCPSNIEFIRRIDSLADEGAVEDVIFDARYLVMGLGDVYLGAPVATPVIGWSRPSTTRRAPGRRKTPWASAAPSCASMGWRGRADTSCSGAPSRWGTPGGAPRPSATIPGCRISSTRSASYLRRRDHARGFDYAPFREAAALLYDGPWLAERLVAVRDFLDSNPGDFDPTLRSIIKGARTRTAVEAFRGQYRLNEPRQKVAPVRRDLDALLLPTSPTMATVVAMQADPAGENSKFGRHTSFADLIGCASIAVPAGFGP